MLTVPKLADQVKFLEIKYVSGPGSCAYMFMKSSHNWYVMLLPPNTNNFQTEKVLLINKLLVLCLGQIPLHSATNSMSYPTQKVCEIVSHTYRFVTYFNVLFHDGLSGYIIIGHTLIEKSKVLFSRLLPFEYSLSECRTRRL
jgi:hypothetical protein